MTELLLRLFVKNHRDLKDPAVRGSVGRLAGTVGLVCNILLFLGKLAVGLAVGALSIVADAMNNLSDASSSLVTLLGFWLARRPADPDHPYGHARYEYLSGLAVAVLIMFLGVELVKSAVTRIFQPVSTQISLVTLGILAAALAVKFWMFLFYGTLGRRIDSLTLKAAAADSRNDVLATLAVLVGCAAERLWNIRVDGWVGLAVAVFIVISGIGLARETISPLLGMRADPELTEQIRQIILSHDKILGIHDLLLHDYGPGQCYASVHVEMSAEEDPLLCHDIIDHIECDLLEQLNVHLVIHYDPVVTADPEWDRLRLTVEDVVGAIDPTLSVHDFRMVRGAEQTKLVFDLALPYAMADQFPALKHRIDDALRAQGIEYPALIRFECAAE